MGQVAHPKEYPVLEFGPTERYPERDMSSPLKKLFDEASALTADDRAELVEMLAATLPFAFDSGVESAWHTEIRRRGDEIANGAVKTVPWEDVDADLEQIVNEKKR